MCSIDLRAFVAAVRADIVVLQFLTASTPRDLIAAFRAGEHNERLCGIQILPARHTLRTRYLYHVPRFPIKL